MQIFVEEDEFLKRASGTRGAGTSSSIIVYRKDAALKKYLKSLDPTKVCNFILFFLYQVMHTIKG